MADSITSAVKENYGAAARSGLSSAQSGVRAVAAAFGYSDAELDSIPASANMGLSCGNPTAMASLRPGEVVVDLGSGGGLDVFLAAQRVGEHGKAIGVDMTPDMIELARRNAATSGGGTPPRNVEFIHAEIDNVPLPSGSVDCVISNCVINLAPDKKAVFREMARLLKDGGRLAISDIALKQPLPEELSKSIAALVGCIGGAIEIDQYRDWLIEAGFSGVEIIDSGADLNAYAQVEGQSGCCSPDMEQSSGLPVVQAACCGASAGKEDGVHAQFAGLLGRFNVNEYAASVKVFAVKLEHCNQ